MRCCLPAGRAPAKNTLLRGDGVGQVASSLPAQDETPPEGKLHVGRDHIFLVQRRIPSGWNIGNAHQMLIKCYPGGIVDPGGEKELPDTRKEECGPPVFLGIATLFFWLQSSRRKAVGGSHAPEGVCVVGSYACREGGESVRARWACHMLIAVPIPASGLGDTASMLSPKGEPWKGGGPRVGAGGLTGREGVRREGGSQEAVGHLGEGRELDVQKVVL